ncbi:hypothetical protein HK097_000788 [Rhizophlyctis rosea]|uniref:C2H2-type domain-containing protein n=1 Tax=Rhizophlyctis rosea TaxID=64517 RepID=A0AAD5X3L9_9FUNG|nr:hypothetical protein HK097_000788 [Rhizophlyctis rosea]
MSEDRPTYLAYGSERRTLQPQIKMEERLRAAFAPAPSYSRNMPILGRNDRSMDYHTTGSSGAAAGAPVSGYYNHTDSMSSRKRHMDAIPSFPPPTPTTTPITLPFLIAAWLHWQHLTTTGLSAAAEPTDTPPSSSPNAVDAAIAAAAAAAASTALTHLHNTNLDLPSNNAPLVDEVMRHASALLSIPTPVCKQEGVQKEEGKKKDEEKEEAKRQFPCTTCGHVFTRKFNLKQHEQVHREDRPRAHKCGQCGRAYFRLADLERHRKNHTTDTKHSCKCGIAFRRHTQLRRHENRCATALRLTPEQVARGNQMHESREQLQSWASAGLQGNGKRKERGESESGEETDSTDDGKLQHRVSEPSPKRRAPARNVAMAEGREKVFRNADADESDQDDNTRTRSMEEWPPVPSVRRSRRRAARVDFDRHLGRSEFTEGF